MADQAPPALTGTTREAAVELLAADGEETWDDYVQAHPQGTPYHLAGWRRVVGEAYGHAAYYLLARSAAAAGRVAGALPLIHLKHFLFGNRLVSMPFCDRGGVLADGPEVAAALLCEAAALGRRLHAGVIELRESGAPPVWLPEGKNPQAGTPAKVAMELDLPGSSAELWDSFKAKLRSQIRRPQKEGLTCRRGGSELLDDFYRVFSVNMRDLGSPVHSRRFLEGVLRVFAGRANLLVVYMGEEPVAGGLVIGRGRVLANPWASSLREYSRLSPNMLLYWGMLEFACERGFSAFDFGRSTPGGGTHRFKKQWGAVEVPLRWQTIPLGGRPAADPAVSSGRERVAGCWRRLPVPVATMLGPLVRKHISL
ncbi:MAG: FemAB family PEP-CTERM system-associated protein [Desulfobacteraceae bacterium]|nr:FemAB family PEP-CTERM system-associated protein [Desulfobacteraceae bacterium]